MADVSKVTHSHQDAVVGAQLQCAAVHLALHDQVECTAECCSFRQLSELSHRGKVILFSVGFVETAGQGRIYQSANFLGQ